MLNNIKSTFSPKPEILCKASEGKQFSKKGFALFLLDLLASAAATLLGEGILMFGIIFIMAFYSVSISGSTDINWLLNADYNMVLNLFVTVGCTICCMLYVKLFEKRKLSTMGFVKKHSIRDYLLGIIIAFVMFSACIVICVASGAMTFDGFVLGGNYIPLILIFAGFMVQGMSEETMCRGFLMTSIGSKYGALAGMLFNSLLFAALHLFNSGISIFALVNLALFGIFMSALVLKLNSIWMACAIHSVWNFVQGNFYGVLVSGIDSGSSVFRFVSKDGFEWINGGSFGMEGGIATTIILTVSIIIVLCMKPRTDEKSEKALTE